MRPPASVVSHKYLYSMSFRSEAGNLNDRKNIQDISRWLI
jgi:hypothetical protein